MMEALFGNIPQISLQPIISIIVVLLLMVILKSKLSQCAYRSPGPWGIPVLGYYPFLPKTDHHIHLLDLSRKYGDAYLMSVLGKLYLHLSSFKAVREAFVTKCGHFSERPQDYSLLMESFKDGILALNGEPWRVWRKFLVQSMKEIGLGTKDQLKNPIQNAISATIKELQENKNEPVNITSLLLTQSTEVIRKLMLGDGVSDKTIQKINDIFRIMVVPWTQFESFLCGRMARCISEYKIKGIKEMREAKAEICYILKSLIDEHEQGLDINDPKDIIDLFLRERQLKTQKGDAQVKHFTEKAFIDILMQIYGDGSFTVGATAAYFLHELAKRDDVQEAMFTEISEIIGEDILPSYEDRMRLPYTNSVMKELMRTFDVFPLQPSLECTEDTTVSDIFVPKGTIAIINAHAVNNDETVYKNPNKFDPERFLLPEDGQSNKENIPLFFGMGKRSCLGETLVSTEVFLFITAIIQKFKIELPYLKNEDAINGDATEYEAEPLQKEFYITATPRISLLSTF